MGRYIYIHKDQMKPERISHIGESIGPRIPLNLLTSAKTINLHCNKVSTLYVRIDKSMRFVNLLELNLSSNRLQEMFDDVRSQSLKGYEHILDVSPQLISFDISANDLDRIGVIFSNSKTMRCLKLQRLNLSRNNIRSIKGIDMRFPRLQVLDISNNCFSLECLPEFAADLVTLNNYLACLNVQGNPFCSDNTHIEVIKRIMKNGALCELNGREISPIIKLETKLDSCRHMEKTMNDLSCSYQGDGKKINNHGNTSNTNDIVEYVDIGIQTYNLCVSLSTQTLFDPEVHQIKVHATSQTEPMTRSVTSRATQIEQGAKAIDKALSICHISRSVNDVLNRMKYYYRMGLKFSFLIWSGYISIDCLKEKTKHVEEIAPDICDLIAFKNTVYTNKQKKMRQLLKQAHSSAKKLEKGLEKKNVQVTKVKKRYLRSKSVLKHITNNCSELKRNLYESKSVIQDLDDEKKMLTKSMHALNKELNYVQKQLTCGKNDVALWKKEIRSEKRSRDETEKKMHQPKRCSLEGADYKSCCRSKS